MFLFIDLETTGLDPTENSILEIHAHLVDANFDSLREYHAVLQMDAEVESQMNEWCRQQHQQSGLVAECKASTKTVREAEFELLEFIGDAKPTLAGNSIHFDRSFIREHMPRLFERLHYRIFDVTTIHTLFEGVDAPGVKRQASVQHRATADIRHSLEVARSARAYLRSRT